jgi:hypothetical protein
MKIVGTLVNMPIKTASVSEYQENFGPFASISIGL